MVRADDDAPLPVTGMGPIVTALDELPAVPLDGVVLANELLDNLPFRIVERADDGWNEVRVGLDGDELTETLLPAADELAAEADLVATDVARRCPAPRPHRHPRMVADVLGRVAPRCPRRDRLRRQRRGARRSGGGGLAAHLSGPRAAARRPS